MITNERQYRITKNELRKFDNAISALIERGTESSTDDELFRQIQVDAMRSQADDLREEVAEYEALRSGERPLLTVESFDQLPQALISARIAAGLTQAELAKRLGVHVQQVQRYEATNYASASTQRLNEVVRALGVGIRIAVTISPPPAHASPAV